MLSLSLNCPRKLNTGKFPTQKYNAHVTLDAEKNCMCFSSACILETFTLSSFHHFCINIQSTHNNFIFLYYLQTLILPQHAMLARFCSAALKVCHNFYIFFVLNILTSLIFSFLLHISMHLCISCYLSTVCVMFFNFV